MLNDLGDDLIDEFSRLKLLAAGTAIGHASLPCTLQNVAKGGSLCMCNRDVMLLLIMRV